ncbi:hypothetical protein AYL99_04509 [Fonsecaea erecta]|uniref:Uncharacterized protein n=1 Tax=Fonsecaea erecta TaxID=1367422 RepID=A0A178ZSE0_9EURO|nr:hypothetical protein AYL99_04509 [Fonsecaea erecta]OAP62306.1 hypothetical protein AYL99_04509 [Fonsecaea erecta]
MTIPIFILLSTLVSIFLSVVVAVPVLRVPQLDCQKDLRDQYRECIQGAEGPWDKVMCHIAAETCYAEHFSYLSVQATAGHGRQTLETR